MATTKAYFDSFYGMVPCTAIACAGDRIVIRVNAARGGWKRGEVVEIPKTHIIPRDKFHRSRKGPFHYYTTPYSWNEYDLPISGATTPF